MSNSGLLGAAQIREFAAQIGLKPTKKLGQNFVIDPNTVSRIANTANLNDDDIVLEVGPGLGSLTLALLPKVHKVLAVEVDQRLADQLSNTVKKIEPKFEDRLVVICQDAMTLAKLPLMPTKLVANLPYNISVPVVLNLLSKFPSISELLVMVQLEVAQRMAAKPGNKIYGIPSLKIAWYGKCELVGNVGRNVFWPAPNVDSGLVRITRSKPNSDSELQNNLFQIIDSAFGQRRKTLRTSLSSIFGSPVKVDEALGLVGIKSSLRGEQLELAQFVSIAKVAGENVVK